MASLDSASARKSFAELQVGDSASASKHFSNAEIEAFAAFSGDLNPVHTDDEYARQLGFRSKLVHAAEMNALLSKILGTQLPGAGNLCLTQNLRFPNPVYAGDTVTMTVSVAQKFAALQTLMLKIEAKNQAGEVVYFGDAKVKVLAPGTSPSSSNQS